MPAPGEIERGGQSRAAAAPVTPKFIASRIARVTRP